MAVSAKYYKKQINSESYCVSCGSAGKESACNTGDLGSIPELGRSPAAGNGNPLQYSCLEDSKGEEPGRLQSVGSKKLDMSK